MSKQVGLEKCQKETFLWIFSISQGAKMLTRNRHSAAGAELMTCGRLRCYCKRCGRAQLKLHVSLIKGLVLPLLAGKLLVVATLGGQQFHWEDMKKPDFLPGTTLVL